MKKKPLAEPIIAPEILDLAKQSVSPQRTKAPKPCVVCGSVSAPQISPVIVPEDEELCWICRRLKISAWRETEQLSVQE